MVNEIEQANQRRSVKLPSAMTGIQRLLEAGMILCSLLALFLLLALYSFSPADPGWSQTAFSGETQNITGTVGAWVADFLLFSFGISAFAFPFFVAGLGWLAFRRYYRPQELCYLTLSLRISGAVLLMIGFCGIASLNIDDFFYYSAGGLLGDFTVHSLMPLFNLAGTTLILLGLTLSGFAFAVGLSWMAIAESIGAFLVWLALDVIYQPLAKRWTSAKEHAAERKEAQAEHEVQTAEVDPAPSVALLTKQERRAEPALVLEELAPFEPEDILDDELDDYEGLSFSAVASEPETDAQTQAPAITEPGASPVADKDIELRALSVEDAEPLPALSLLDCSADDRKHIPQEVLDRVSRLVEEKLADFNIEARVVNVLPGPVITRFELDLAPGVKVSKITTLSKDLARSLSAISVRVVEVIPGKSFIGLEIPNEKRETVRLSETLASTAFDKSQAPLTMALGHDIAGEPVIVNLAKMPHLLVAGTTGSGKSVGVNAMIISMLYKSAPEDVRFIMIDPKMLELSVYEGIPHLLTEVVTDMKDASNALRWCVGEMERRYKLMSALGVRNLKGFNDKVSQAQEAGEPICDPLWKPNDSLDHSAPELEALPHIVVVVDEFADLIMIVGKKVEELIARIAQKARAAGIHLILATQRPSVDVITGLIKANIPTRIAFQVSSRVDSRTILDQQGAEQLLGQGDMLYLPPGSGVPTRVHGAFVSDDEVHRVVDDWKKRGKPNYLDEILRGDITEDSALPGERSGGEDDYDPLYDEALAFVTESRRGSISSVQRKLKIGYNRAARIIEQMEADGVVSAAGHNGNREVIAPPPPRDVV